MTESDGASGAGARRATIREVAALAGVGIKTVSRVINDEPNVSALMHRKVMQAIRELDYHPNHNAVALNRSGGKNGTIGLVVSNVANRFWATLHRGVEDMANERGVDVLASSLDDDEEREDRVIGKHLQRRVDALILAPARHDQSRLAVEQQRGTPLVFVDRDPIGVEADVVLTNDRTAAQQAVAHLVAHGHRSIAFLGDRPGIWPTEQRRLGFFDALSEAGISSESATLVQDLRDTDAARAATLTLLTRSDRPTAIFSSQNSITVGALHALRELGLENTIAIVGFNDVALSDLISPGLTAMVQNPYQMGRIAASRAFARLDGDDTAQRIVLRSALVIRGSGEIRPPQ